MHPLTPLRSIAWLTGVARGDKSFRENPVLGSPALNRRGLHRERVRVAAALAARRRNALAPRLATADRECLEREGCLVKPDFLPPADFRRLRDAVFAAPLPAREMRQGPAVNRMFPLASAPLAPVRDLAVRPEVRALVGYAAGRGGAPAVSIQTVIADTVTDGSDPQAELHADTFHPTAKFWLFLDDVADDDGPFVYVPGSHRLTPERLRWEYAQSLTARDDPRLHHALGSFRIDPAELSRLGYGQPRRFAVAANTLVVADTFGFHQRAPSRRPTTRVAVYGYLRRNPFVPWNGLHLAAFPGVAPYQVDAFVALLDLRRRLLGRGSVWTDVGPVRVDAPPRV